MKMYLRFNEGCVLCLVNDRETVLYHVKAVIMGDIKTGLIDVTADQMGYVLP